MTDGGRPTRRRRPRNGRSPTRSCPACIRTRASAASARDFYLVNSSFEYFPGVPIFHSRDLVSWTQIGHVLTRESQLDLAGVYSSGGIYAPTLRHHAGRFYMITTLVGSPKRGGNFYVTATTRAGPGRIRSGWIDGEHGGFDPSLLFADGEVVLPARRQGRRRRITRASSRRASIRRRARCASRCSAIWEGTGGIWPEGAHVYKMKGRYYLFAAEGGTEYGHAEVVGRERVARSARSNRSPATRS